MGTLNFADGASVTIRIKRTARAVYRSTVSIPSYGVNPVKSADTSAWLGRVEVLNPPAGLTSITAANAGGRARVTPRSDGRLTVDMLRHDGDASDLRISLTGKRDGTTVTEELIAPVAALQETHGQGTGRHPAPHTVGTTPVYYPSTNHRKIYVSLAGFTKTEIEAREGLSNATGGWLATTNAKAQETPGKGYNPGGAHKYGETPDLALDQDRARQLASNGLPDATPEDRLRTVEILLHRGEDTTSNPIPSFDAGGAVGRGPLHPCIVTTYGDGDRPIYNGSPSGAYGPNNANWITHGFTIKDEDITLTHAPYSAFVDVRFDNGDLAVLLAKQNFPWGLTVQNYVSNKNVVTPSGTGTWSEKPTHETGIYVQSGHSTLLKDSFLYHAGWEEGYDPDISLAFPDPPEQWSQNAYLSAGGFNIDDGDERLTRSKDITLVNVMSTEAAANGLQVRPGGVILGGFYGRNNVDMLIGGGPDLSATVSDGNYSYGFGFVVSGVAFKTTNTGKSPVTGKGVQIGGLSTVLDDYVIANVGDVHPSSIAYTEFKSDSPALSISVSGGVERTPRYNSGVIWGWTNSATNNPNSVSTSALDDISPTGWMDEQFPSNAPHTWEDFNAYCVASDTPWEIEAAFRSWARDKAGYDETPRTSALSFTFAPNATIPTPGCRWDISRDWSSNFTGKVDHNIPGTVSGYTDDVDLDGHWVSNYLTLEPLGNFDLGANGHLYAIGGYLRVTGSLSGSGTIETDQRGIFVLDGTHSLAGITPTIGGRLENHGTLTGDTDYNVYGYGELLLGVDDASFTLPSGGTLTVDGPLARAGWDGGSGGTSTADFQAGSTVTIKPGVALTFGGFDNDLFLFVPGSTVRGATSGATARISNFWHFSNVRQSEGVMYLYDVAGTFQAGENLIGERYDHFNVLENQTIGQVVSADTMIPYIKKERFGYFGAVNPNVTANVTLGGAWEVDITNIADGTHTLLECDALAGRPSGFTATGLGSARDATLTIGAKTVTLTLAAGTGQTVLA